MNRFAIPIIAALFFIGCKGSTKEMTVVKVEKLSGMYPYYVQGRTIDGEGISLRMPEPPLLNSRLCTEWVDDHMGDRFWQVVPCSKVPA